MMNPKNSITVLGCEYQITVVQHDQYKTCEGCDGWTDPYSKKIFLIDQTANPDCDPIATDPAGRMKQVLRHEIVHAFLNESGLVYNSNFSMQGWATNEEMVDWIAWNGEKLYQAWKEAGLVD